MKGYPGSLWICHYLYTPDYPLVIEIVSSATCHIHDQWPQHNKNIFQAKVENNINNGWWTPYPQPELTLQEGL